MFFFKYIIVSFLITLLSLYVLASAIPQVADVSASAGSQLSDRDVDETFTQWLASQGVSEKLKRHLEGDLPVSEAVDGSRLASRDTSADPVPDTTQDGRQNLKGTRISARASQITTFAELRDQMKKIFGEDAFCFAKAGKLGIAFPGFVGKRVDRPSNVLWDSAKAMIVGMGSAIYHDWASQPPNIGTKGLCGCTAVTIVSQVGSIVAHISPNIDTVDSQLAEILRLYNTFIRPQAQAYCYYFPPAESDGVTLKVAPFQNYIKHYIETNLVIGASLMPYIADPLSTDSHEGTVLVSKVAGAIKLFLNDEQIN